MKYRPFGHLDWQVSALGFGCMRLPILDGKPEVIDEALAVNMIRQGIDQGINYIDTAYAYHGGMSEPLVGKALTGGYRQKVRLATKSPVWLVHNQADFDRILDEQLVKLQTSHIDFYLLHALNRSRWPSLRDLGILTWAEKAIQSGRIGHIGFSFHDDYPLFEQIIKDYDGWTFCQIQYNYLDLEEQAGLKGLQLAAEKGLAVVAMEPLMGGKLAAPPPKIQAIFDQAPVKRSPSDWALQWLWDQPEISLLLSGMSDMQQVEQNLSSANNSTVGLLTQAEREMVDSVREIYRALIPIPCTKCRYCMPCPNGLNIPYLFELFNKGVMVEDWGSPRFRYSQVLPAERASECIACMECEQQCPQNIAISEWMPVLETVLGQTQPWNEHIIPGR